MSSRSMIRAACAAGVLALLTTAGCGGPAASASAEVPQPAANRGFPGFDLLRYPGDSAMRAWQPPFSPYQWVGYYLPAPCHRDASWAGTRARVEEMGYGIGVIYVGQQVWEGAPEPQPDSAGQAGPIICSRTLLSAARGRQDAADAIAKAAADGFPRGTIIYLDLERMTTIPDAMRDYYRAWGAALLADGRYRPGVYVHGVNADDVHEDYAALYAEAGRREDDVVPLWLAQPDPAFATTMAPTDAGDRRARVWQGRINFDETWRGVTLRIDANVADRRSPSAP